VWVFESTLVLGTAAVIVTTWLVYRRTHEARK
jgi:hypothetical protein